MFNNAETSSLWGSNFHGLDLTSNFVSSPAPSSLENMPYSAFGTSPTNSAFRLPKNSTHTATTIAAGVNEAEEVACLTRAKDTFFQDLKRMKTCVSDLSMEFVNSSNEESMTRDRMDQTLMFVDLIMTDLQNLRGLVVKKLDNQKPIPQVLHHSASEDHEQKAPQDKDKLIVSTTEEVVNTTITRNNLKSDTRLSDNSEANVKINRNNNQLLSEAISQLDDLSLIEENNSPIQNKKSVSPTSESSCAKEGDDEMDIPPIIDAKGVKIIPRNKLHVSRLPGNVSRDFAVEIFSKYGNLESLHFPSYKKRTFLFARYKTIKDAIKVYKSPPVFPGEEAPVRIQFYDENYKNPHGDVNTHLKLVLENNVKKLFVKGIPQACHWQELKDYFRKNFGEVINVDVYPSHNPYVSHMGCGEVEMLHLEDARKVVAQAKHVLQGEIIRIEPHRITLEQNRNRINQYNLAHPNERRGPLTPVNIRVPNLPFQMCIKRVPMHITDREMFNFLKNYGAIEHFHLGKDKYGYKANGGMAFVAYFDSSVKNQLLRDKTIRYKGVDMQVELYTKKIH